MSLEYMAMSPSILRGPIADPAISLLLNKELLAQIKVRQLDMEIQQARQYMDMLKMQRDMLAEQYKVK
jgi:hypothetical protein